MLGIDGDGGKGMEVGSKTGINASCEGDGSASIVSAYEMSTLCCASPSSEAGVRTSRQVLDTGSSSCSDRGCEILFVSSARRSANKAST